MNAMRARMRKEIEMLESDPPYGISAWPKDDQLDRLEAQILGPEGSPYDGGVFLLDIEIPERYPFEPPKVRFVTPIYHPNIDDAGRICLDTLKMQPKGSWMPSVNISTLLTTIRLLMAEPNADDGLMPEITDLYKHNRELFRRKAVEMTKQHATETAIKAASADNKSTATTTATAEATTAATRSVEAKRDADDTEAREKVQQVARAATKRERGAEEAEDSFSDDDQSDDSDFSDDEQSAPSNKRTRH
ncbi:hypothetical protein PINS_up000308 [Pythium insidiosum]|nr:hypothetical protein PINS_up000308 [Pythium insidiosum]